MTSAGESQRDSRCSHVSSKCPWHHRDCWERFAWGSVNIQHHRMVIWNSNREAFLQPYFLLLLNKTKNLHFCIISSSAEQQQGRHKARCGMKFLVNFCTSTLEDPVPLHVLPIANTLLWRSFPRDRLSWPSICTAALLLHLFFNITGESLCNFGSYHLYFWIIWQFFLSTLLEQVTIIPRSS